MNTKDVLTTALLLTGGARATQHGDKRLNHKNIADLWSAYFRLPFTEHDVAMAMVLVKVARTRTGQPNADDYIDMAGYAAIASELSDQEGR